MPVICYTEYKPVSESPREINIQEHELGRQLLYTFLRDKRGIPLSPADISVTEKGKPYLPAYPEIHFNISHCNGLVVCAIDEESVGVDCERPGYFGEILIRKVLAASEQQLLAEKATTDQARQEWFFRLWTLKEAYVKWTGTGVDTDLTAFSFSFSEDPDRTDLQPRCSDPSVCCYQTKLPSGHIVSLCHTGKSGEITLQPLLRG